MVTVKVFDDKGILQTQQGFDQRPDADAWVEKNLKSLPKGYTVDVQEDTTEETKAEAARVVAAQALSDRKIAFQEIKTLVLKRNRTLAETNDLIDKLCALLNKIL